MNELKELYQELRKLQERFRMFQVAQRNEKERHNSWFPEDEDNLGQSRWEHEMICQSRIRDIKRCLRNLQVEIIQAKKRLKDKQRELADNKN